MTEETDKLERKEDRRKSPTMKPSIFDGSTLVEAFVQQFKACAQYYKWTEKESSVRMKYALSGDAASLVWSQTKPEQHTVEQLQELLRERYDSAKPEEKIQAELRASRRKTNSEGRYITAYVVGVSRRCIEYGTEDGDRLFSGCTG